MNHHPREPSEVIAYCPHCLRDDYHAIELEANTRSVLFELTIGIIAIIEPVRCCACGRSRMRGIRSLCLVKKKSTSRGKPATAEDRQATYLPSNSPLNIGKQSIDEAETKTPCSVVRFPATCS